MKQKFRDVRLNVESFEQLEKVNEVIEEFAQEGYRLSLRQLFYQLVTRNLIRNELKAYKKLSVLLTEGRMAGFVDWEYIDDRLRVPDLLYYVKNIQDAFDDTVYNYRLNRQKHQKNYLEIWVEKDAQSDILRKITHKYHVPLIINRGYSSCTAMFRASKRLNYKIEAGHHEEMVILYLGDHDPSGLDMLRDIEKRFDEFGIYPKLVHVALTMKQIEKLKLPPNPAKLSDSRAKEYIEKFGRESWELDALGPKNTEKILEENILKYLDENAFSMMIEQEKSDIEKIRGLVDSIGDSNE